MNLSKGLGSLGCALILLPIAVVCGALIVALCLSSPTVGLIAVIVIAALIAGQIDKRRKKS